MKEAARTVGQWDNIAAMNEKILQMKALGLALESDAGQFPGICKNAKRALASIKMMELNLCDLVSFDLISVGDDPENS
jgi:hypothetical protein